MLHIVLDLVIVAAFGVAGWASRIYNTQAGGEQ